MPNRYLLLFLTLLCPSALLHAGGDSLVSRKQLTRLDLAGSYTTENNHWTEKQQMLMIKGMAETRLRANFQSGWKHDHYLHTQLGYSILSDSTWVKSADVFKVQLRWMEKSYRKLMHTYSFRLQSQWLNSWSLYADRKVWSGGFMNPSTFEMGYSFTFDFLNNSNLMLTPATFQVSVQPESIRSLTAEDRPLVKTKHSHIFSRYGFSGFLNMDEYFFKDRLLLQHQSRLFFNALSARQIQFEVSNKICIRLLKYLQLRLDTLFLYEPEQSLKIQYRQEVLLGIFYEHRR